MWLDDILSFARTAKMWVAGLIAAVTQVIQLIQVAAADEAISFDEAKGIWLAITGAISTLLVMIGVYKTANKTGASNG